MISLNKIEVKLKERFPDLILHSLHFRDELSLEVSLSAIKEILTFLKQPDTLGFEVLMDLTAVDYLYPEQKTKVLYWLHNPSNYLRIRIFTFVKREEEIPTVVDLWEGAAWYERELYDLFGLTFKGHQNLRRLLMPDDWTGHPLRKDYPLKEERVAFKHEAKPKVPSDIIDLKGNQKNLAD